MRWLERFWQSFPEEPMWRYPGFWSYVAMGVAVVVAARFFN